MDRAKYQRGRWKNDPEWRKRRNASMKKWRKANPEKRKVYQKRKKERWHTDPEYKARRTATTEKWRKGKGKEKYKVTQKKIQQKRYSRPSFIEMNRERAKKRTLKRLLEHLKLEKELTKWQKDNLHELGLKALHLLLHNNQPDAALNRDPSLLLRLASKLVRSSKH